LRYAATVFLVNHLDTLSCFLRSQAILTLTFFLKSSRCSRNNSYSLSFTSLGGLSRCTLLSLPPLHRHDAEKGVLRTSFFFRLRITLKSASRSGDCLIHPHNLSGIIPISYFLNGFPKCATGYPPIFSFIILRILPDPPPYGFSVYPSTCYRTSAAFHFTLF